MKLVKDLKEYACKHVEDQGPSGQTGHSATDGTSYGDRIKKLMVPNYIIGENISYGSAKAHDAVMALAIDDGVASRGHRKNLFKADYSEMGSCNGPHKTIRNMAVSLYRGKSSGEADSGGNDTIAKGKKAESKKKQ